MTVDMHRDPRVLTNRLSTLMGTRRVSVAEVARATGPAYKTVYDLYHARSAQVHLETLNRLCNYFGVGPSEIFEWQPDVEPGAGAEGRQN